MAAMQIGSRTFDAMWGGPPPCATRVETIDIPGEDYHSTRTLGLKGAVGEVLTWKLCASAAAAETEIAACAALAGEHVTVIDARNQSHAAITVLAFDAGEPRAIFHDGALKYLVAGRWQLRQDGPNV